VRVLMLSKALVVGAYQVKLEEMARQRDIDLTVVVPAFWREGSHITSLQRVHTSGYELIVADMALNGHFHLHFYPRLASIVSRARPDVFHIDEEPYNHATFQAMSLGRSAGARCLFFTWQNLYRPQPWNLAERYTLSRADAAIAGNADAEAVLRRKGFRKEIAVIPQFGVDPGIYQPNAALRAQRSDSLPFAVSPQTFVIGYLGRLVEQKGLLVLLHAVAGLDGDWRLLMLGDGPLRPKLEALAAELGVAARVAILPSVPSTDVPRWLNTLDCLVLPSLTRANWKEQFGRVLVEAMACGVPCIGSDSGEIPNVIGDAGLVVHEGNADDLRRSITLLATGQALRQRLVQQGRARVLADYTQAAVARATYDFYRRLLNGAPGAT
jgi:glycosyltransferase involved in cell wall biosynthesis